MSASKIQICNLALSKLNAENIVNVTDDSRSAELCNDFYDSAVDAVLRSYLWNCAKERVTLAALATAPLFDWDYQYELPVDCLRVIRSEPDQEFVIEAGKLLTDCETCSILYIKRIDAGAFDPLLVECVALDLAAKIAFPLSGNPALTQKMEDSRERKLLEARAVNSIENNVRNQNRIKSNSAWHKARY